MKGSDEKKSEGCCEFDKCLKVLYLMLDNEASKEEEAYLMGHIDKCLYCFEQYEVEKQIRELLRTKVARLPVPEGLAENIKSKISQSA